MLSLCTRYTILGIVWLLTLGIIVVVRKRKFFERGNAEFMVTLPKIIFEGLVFVVVLFIVTLCFQYFVALEFPPSVNLDFPWSDSIPLDYQEWLLLYIPNLQVLTGTPEIPLSILLFDTI